MTLLDIAQQHGLQPRPIKGGAEYYSGCPGCGSSGDRSDRFRIWPQGGKHRQGVYWCRQCGKKGDAVQFLIDFTGLSFKEAAEKTGLQIDTPRPTQQAPPPQPAWQPQPGRTPAERWQEKAAAFVDFAHAEFLKNDEQLAYLAGRGIGLDLVQRFKLGWNAEIFFRSRTGWGLPEEIKDNGKPRMLGFQPGIVIPLIFCDTVLRLRIRTGKPELPYYLVPGSITSPMLIAPVNKTCALSCFVVVESELDAILLAGIAADMPGVGIMAAGNTTVRPTTSQADALNRAFDLLIAMDTDGKPGGKAAAWWLQQFPRAVRWPVPVGKDPGEAYRAGADLKAWLRQGLSYRFVLAMDDASRTALIEQSKGEGPEEQGSGHVGAGSSRPIAECRDEKTNTLLALMAVMRRYDVRLDKRKGGIHIRCKKEEGERAVSELIYADGSRDVWEFIDEHPAQVVTVDNFWD